MTIEELKNMSLEIVNKAEAEQRDLSEDENKALEKYKAKIAELRAMEDDKKEEKVDTPVKEGESEDKTSEEIPSESGKTEEEKSEDKPEDKEEKTDNKKSERNLNKLEIKKDNIRMEKKFSLLKTIRSIANGEKLDESTQAVINAGREEMRKASFSFDGQIQLPSEKRDIVSVTAEGEDIVQTDVYNVLEPLRSKLVLADAGAHFMGGLVGDVQIPVMTKENAFWAEENGEAADGAGTFSNVKLSPKRLTAFVDISKQLIAQDSVGAENLIREDIVNAIAHKLQETILGNGAKTATQPAGLFNGLTPTKVTDFKGIVDLEAEIEDANVGGNITYIASNKAKAEMRNMQKGTKNNTVLAYAGGELDGTPVYSTSDVDGKKFLVGDFSNLYIGQWGAVDLTVDNYTQATKGAVRLVVNAYFDAVLVRPEAIKAGDFAAE